jgi:hypothetical protein
MIKKLEDEYFVNNIQWKILKRTDTKFIAERVFGGRSYEVCMILIRKPSKFFKEDMTLEGIEVIPSNEQFGSKGWSFTTKELAFDCYDRLP